MREKKFTAALALMFLVLGFSCAGTRPDGPPVSTLKGGDVVLILQHDSHYNFTLKEKITDHLLDIGYKTVADEEWRADLYKATDYAAVVLLLKHEAKGSMRIAEEFIDKFNNRANLIVSISHEWDVDASSINKEYDAVTAPSKDFDQAAALEKINTKLNAVLER